MTHFLKKPSALWGSFFIAAAIAYFLPDLGALLKTPSDIYLSLFEMCVIPLLMTSLISSIAYMMSVHTEKYKISSVIITFLILSIGLSLFGIIIFMLLQGSGTIAEDPLFLKITTSGEGAHPLLLTMGDTIRQSNSFIGFFKNMFTDNIFYSLYNSMILQIIFFSILVGSATGCLTEDKKNLFLNFIASIDAIFKKIIGWVMSVLPLGIICIFSSRFLEVKINYIKIFIYPIISIILSMIILIFIINYIISKKMKMRYFDVLNHLKKTLILSISTNSVIATMPTYMQSLEDNFKIDMEKTKLYIPITLTTFRFGSIYYFACLSIVAAQIFSIPLTFIDCATLIFLSILGGFSAVSTGILNVKILAMIFQPLGIPSGLIISIFSILDPIFDPFRTVLNFYLNLLGIIFSVDKK